MIKSQCKYCLLVSMFCSKKSNSSVKRVQERALRWTNKDNENNFQTLINENNKTCCFCRIMIRGEDHLYELFWNIYWRLILCWFIFTSCVNQFPANASCDLTFSVSLGLCRIQLSDLAYRLADWTLCGMLDTGRVESERTIDSSYLFNYLVILFLT